MLTKYKLIFFDCMGRGELIRLIFAEKSIPYEDFRLPCGPETCFPKEKWPDLKKSMPFGTLPVLEVDDSIFLSGSIAIARYLANEFGLAGKTNLEKQQADALIDALNDLFNVYYPVHYEQDSDKKKSAYEKFDAEKLQPFLKLYAGFLSDNENSDYFVGNEFTYADLAIFQLMGFFREKYPQSVKEETVIGNFIDFIGSRPNIKAWVDKRPKTHV